VKCSRLLAFNNEFYDETEFPTTSIIKGTYLNISQDRIQNIYINDIKRNYASDNSKPLGE